MRALERAFSLIRAECDALMAGQIAMPRHHDVNHPATEISATTPGDWKVFMLELLGHRPDANRARCPATCAALRQVPGVLQAFFSVVDPGKPIPAHDGPYLRYHLGIRVPRLNPPHIRVAGQPYTPYTWKEGEGVLFDDSWPHEVVNQATRPRTVLIVDIPRPLPLLPRLVNNFVLWAWRHRSTAKKSWPRWTATAATCFDLRS